MVMVQMYTCMCINTHTLRYETLPSSLHAVFHQGDKGGSWYIILKGSVNVIIRGKVRRGREV